MPEDKDILLPIAAGATLLGGALFLPQLLQRKPEVEIQKPKPEERKVPRALVVYFNPSDTANAAEIATYLENQGWKTNIVEKKAMESPNTSGYQLVVTIGGQAINPYYKRAGVGDLKREGDYVIVPIKFPDKTIVVVAGYTTSDTRKVVRRFIETYPNIPREVNIQKPKPAAPTKEEEKKTEEEVILPSLEDQVAAAKELLKEGGRVNKEVVSKLDEAKNRVSSEEAKRSLEEAKKRVEKGGKAFPNGIFILYGPGESRLVLLLRDLIRCRKPIRDLAKVFFDEGLLVEAAGVLSTKTTDLATLLNPVLPVWNQLTGKLNGCSPNFKVDISTTSGFTLSKLLEVLALYPKIIVLGGPGTGGPGWRKAYEYLFTIEPTSSRRQVIEEREIAGTRVLLIAGWDKKDTLKALANAIISRKFERFLRS